MRLKKRKKKKRKIKTQELTVLPASTTRVLNARLNVTGVVMPTLLQYKYTAVLAPPPLTAVQGRC